MKKARFRFYEELNDFLPPHRKKKSFTYTFKLQPSIKDAIEAIGVPHAEIDLIIVNGESVDFTYQLKDNDEVAVYPVFEALDISPIIHLREKPLRQVKFILDVHLGKLAKDLRLLGFDTTYQNQLDDQAIIKHANDENRIILTRDIGLLKNKKVTHGYWLRTTNPDQQIKEILTRFDLYQSINPLTRCLLCNELLQPIKKEKIIAKIPQKTAEAIDDFFICKTCKKIYWHGSHVDRMLKRIKMIIGSKQKD